MVCLHSPQQNHPLSPLHEPLHWRAQRDPKAKMLYLQSFLWKSVLLSFVGLNSNPKGPKAPKHQSIKASPKHQSTTGLCLFEIYPDTSIFRTGLLCFSGANDSDDNAKLMTQTTTQNCSQMWFSLFCASVGITQTEDTVPRNLGPKTVILLIMRGAFSLFCSYSGKTSRARLVSPCSPF